MTSGEPGISKILNAIILTVYLFIYWIIQIRPMPQAIWCNSQSEKHIMCHILNKLGVKWFTIEPQEGAYSCEGLGSHLRFRRRHVGIKRTKEFGPMRSSPKGKPQISTFQGLRPTRCLPDSSVYMCLFKSFSTAYCPLDNLFSIQPCHVENQIRP